MGCRVDLCVPYRLDSANVKKPKDSKTEYSLASSDCDRWVDFVLLPCAGKFTSSAEGRCSFWRSPGVGSVAGGDMASYLAERCYCPGEVYDISGRDYNIFSAKDEVRLIGEFETLVCYNFLSKPACPLNDAHWRVFFSLPYILLNPKKYPLL